MEVSFVFKYIFAAIFIVGGALHFIIPETYIRMMPDYLPWHKAAVAVSGIFEILLGIMLIVPTWSETAAWGLIALLIAVLPANINMALHPEKYVPLKPAALWTRLPIQALLLWWAYQYT